MSTAFTIDPVVTRRLGLGLIGAGALWAIAPVHPPLPCPLRVCAGIPCPFCGLTRAVTAACRFDVAASLHYNPFGLVLLIGAVVAFVGWRSRTAPIQVPSSVVVGVVAAMWAWNLVLNPTFQV